MIFGNSDPGIMVNSDHRCFGDQNSVIRFADDGAGRVLIEISVNCHSAQKCSTMMKLGF